MDAFARTRQGGELTETGAAAGQGDKLLAGFGQGQASTGG